MRRIVAAGLVSLSTGCSDNLLGWWDLELWEVEREGQVVSRRDAGFLAWGDPDYGGSFEMGLSYVYDWVTFDLVPDPHPTVGLGAGPGADDIELTPVGEVDFTISVGEEFIPVPFDITTQTATVLELDTPDPLADGSIWHWRLRR